MYHITIVTSYPFPGFAATSNRVMAFAKVLSSQDNVRVSVIGPGPDLIDFKHSTKIHSFKVYSSKNSNFTGNNLFSRAISEIKAFINLKNLVLQKSPNLIIVTIPSIFLLGISLFISKKIPIIIDVRDLVWEYFLKKSFLYKAVGKFIKVISIRFLKQADAVTVTNNKEFDILKNDLITPIIIRNGLDQNRLDQLSTMKKEKKENRHKINITYAGNVGLAQKLDTLIFASREFSNIETTIIGGGKDLNRLKKYVNENKIINVSFTGQLDWEDIIPYYTKTDIFYLQIGKEFASAVPSKIFEYLAIGKIVIISAPLGPATQLATIFKGVKIVKPENEKLLKKLIKTILQTDYIKNDYSSNKKLIEKYFLREEQSKKLLPIIQKHMILFNQSL
tara:strand:- start:273 stop:1445 length:1173 start_codon:yes stop_codon:yes gene_type:complete